MTYSILEGQKLINFKTLELTDELNFVYTLLQKFKFNNIDFVTDFIVECFTKQTNQQILVTINNDNYEVFFDGIIYPTLNKETLIDILILL